MLQISTATTLSTPEPDPSRKWEAQLKQTIQDNLQPILLDTKRTYEEALHRIPPSASTRRQSLTYKYETTVRELRRNAEEQFQREVERERKEREWAKCASAGSESEGVLIDNAGRPGRDWDSVFEEQQAILVAIRRSEDDLSPRTVSLYGASSGLSTPSSIASSEGSSCESDPPLTPVSSTPPGSPRELSPSSESMEPPKSPSDETGVDTPSSPLPMDDERERKKRIFEKQQEEFRQRELEIKRNIEQRKRQDQLNWEESVSSALSSRSSSSSASSFSSASSSSSVSSLSSSPIVSISPLLYAHSKAHIPTRELSSAALAPVPPVSTSLTRHERRPPVVTSSASAAAAKSHSIAIAGRNSSSPNTKVLSLHTENLYTSHQYHSDPAFSTTPPASSAYRFASTFPSSPPAPSLSVPVSSTATPHKGTYNEDVKDRILAIYSRHEQQWLKIAAYHELWWSDFPWPVLAEPVSPFPSSPSPIPSSDSTMYSRSAFPSSPTSSSFAIPPHYQYHHSHRNSGRSHSSHFQHGQQYPYTTQHYQQSYHYSSSSLLSSPVSSSFSSYASSSPRSSTHSGQVVDLGHVGPRSHINGSPKPVAIGDGAQGSGIDIRSSLPKCPRDLDFQAIREYMLSPYYPTLSSSSTSNDQPNHNSPYTQHAQSDTPSERKRLVEIQRDRIKEQIRKWHPDRFEVKYLRKIRDEKEREMVKEGVEVLVKCLNEILREVEREAALELED